MKLGQCNPKQKLLWHVDRVAEWDKTGTTRPLLFEIDPSNKCNQNCPWCSFSKLRSESKDIMCLETIKHTLDSMARMGVKAITWSGGGEPLVNPVTVEAIEFAHSLGLDQGIFTNGLLLKQEVADRIYDKMTWIRFSLDGDRDDYKESHGTSDKAFDVVIKNIEYLCSKKDRCTVGVGFIITPENYKGIENVAEIAKKCGADYVQYKPVVRRPGEKQVDKKLILDEFIPRVQKACLLEDDNFDVMVTEYRFKDILDGENNYGRNYKKCLSHHFQGAIGADSKVYLCDHHKGEKEYELGDLKKDSLGKIWSSGKRSQVIKWLDSTDLSQCMSCCRNHEANKFLWEVKSKDKSLHPNHI